MSIWAQFMTVESDAAKRCRSKFDLYLFYQLTILSIYPLVLRFSVLIKNTSLDVTFFSFSFSSFFSLSLSGHEGKTSKGY